MALLLLLFLLGACDKTPQNNLERVKAAGELVVLTRNGPTTYYQGPDGPAGIEYDLAQAFAVRLGVALRIEVVPDSADILTLVAERQGDFAAAGLTVTEEREKRVRFSPHYQEIRPQVVYRLGTPKPRGIDDLIGRQIEVSANAGHAEILRRLQQEHPDLRWAEVAGTPVEELLLSVWEGLVEFAVADSHVLALNRQYYPELGAAFDLDRPQRLAWAFPLDEDDSLYDAAAGFFAELRGKELRHFIERYYGPARRFNYVNTSHYLSRISDTLPAYRPLFEQAAAQHDLDWRLLAAVGYQESYWDASAVSPTGVRGIMMLTIPTSQRVGVTDRTDPRQSIEGGARYLRDMIERMPPRVQQPDRTWMALAAYNVGIHHLEDARVITQKQGGDPNKWLDVEKRLPLLARPEWYSQTRFGYARGHEPVQYVNRIRSYYDILVKIDEEEKAKERPAVPQVRAPAI